VYEYKGKDFFPGVRRLVNNVDSIRVNGKTVGECLNDMVRQYPGVDKLIFDERGRLLKQVYVYVNAESLNKADFAKPVTDKDELILAVLITGG
jgi:hypothetical protein